VKAVKAVEIAIKWIQNCPGAILYVPEYPQVPIFYFGKEKIEKLIENLFPHSNLMYVVKKAGEEGFWNDFDKEQDGEAKRMDELMDELDETEGFVKRSK
jgi:hypothetical protein